MTLTTSHEGNVTRIVIGIVVTPRSMLTLGVKCSHLCPSLSNLLYGFKWICLYCGSLQLYHVKELTM